MDEWLYEPDADLDASQIERLNPGRLIRGFRGLSTSVVHAWLRVYHGLTIVGREHLPAGRSFILVANHSSHLDTLCLLAALGIRQRLRTYPVAARDYFCVNGARKFLAGMVVSVLPFDRHFAPWQSLSACAHLLNTPGNVLIFFPEGTRAKGGGPGAFKSGVGFLAAGRDIPVVPCHLAGTHAALPKGAWFPRPRAVRLTIGEPLLFSHLPPTKDSAKRISRELHDAVSRLGGVESGGETRRRGREVPEVSRLQLQRPN